MRVAAKIRITAPEVDDEYNQEFEMRVDPDPVARSLTFWIHPNDYELGGVLSVKARLNSGDGRWSIEAGARLRYDTLEEVTHAAGAQLTALLRHRLAPVESLEGEARWIQEYGKFCDWLDADQRKTAHEYAYSLLESRKERK